MAKLFLSYSRKDEAKARRFSKWLALEGHDVWRDEDDIRGGASFSSEIEAALKECDLVLVLWSAASVQSAWVRDEAAFGRDAGKLIPFSLDKTEPPLGFRQFQAIDLSRWKSHGEPAAADRIRRSLEEVAGDAAASPGHREQRRVNPPWLALAGFAIAIGLFALLVLVAWRHWSGSREIAISVQPSPASSDRAMASDYATVAVADMAATLPKHFDHADVLAAGDSGGTRAYRMLVATNSHGAAVDASLTLSDQDGHAILWSKTFSAADAAAADLKQQVSVSASKAALCLAAAKSAPSPLDQPALGLFLQGCAELGDTDVTTSDFVAIFQRVTSLAPDFAPGWDYLALSQSWVAQGLRDSSPAAYSAALQTARKTIAIARRLNPASAMSYDAEFHLISNDTFRAMEVLDRGARIDPSDGRIQMHLSETLLSVGRMSDSVAASEQAVELDPGSPYTRAVYIGALAYSGEFAKAKQEIVKARQQWPGDPQIDLADFTYEYRYGDPKAALALLPKVGDQSDADLALTRQLIEARLDPSPAKIDRAVSDLEARWGNDSRTEGTIFRALGEFGRVDEVYRLLDDPKFRDFVETDVLFRPDFAGVRADPRFMQAAARLGLVSYWRRTGYWPDFCANERLPYDCKTEAAKYA